MVLTDPEAVRRQAGPIAKALNKVEAETGRSFTMRTQPGRFRIQKTVYLLRHMGYPPAQRYSFNLYHMGPYSPDLAAAYYNLEDDGLGTAGASRDIPAATLATLKEALEQTDPFLEGLTTLLDTWRVSRDLRVALPQARAVKPHLNENTWKEVRRFITAHPALTPPT